MQDLRMAEMTVATICHSQTETDALSEAFRTFADGSVKSLYTDYSGRQSEEFVLAMNLVVIKAPPPIPPIAKYPAHAFPNQQRSMRVATLPLAAQPLASPPAAPPSVQLPPVQQHGRQ